MTGQPHPREILAAHGLDAGAIDGVLDLHAHELAARQREAIPDIMESWGGYMHQDMLRDLADSIDPEVRR